MDNYLKKLVDDSDVLFEMIEDFLKWCKEQNYPVDALSFEMYYGTP